MFEVQGMVLIDWVLSTLNLFGDAMQNEMPARTGPMSRTRNRVYIYMMRFLRDDIFR